MMSLIDLDDEQRWVPTHVNVTVLRARGLRTKGKHGSRYLYTIIQVGKEKYTTGLVEKAEVPEWSEECCFELLPGILEDGGRGGYPPGSGDLVLTVMHRVLIGLDVFLGQAVIPLDRIFQDGMCPRDEWFKLNSKAGRKEKERGELQVTVQFTRNNMTASMFDLTMKDKPRSAFGKLKDRVTGRKRGDVESSSAIVPGRYAALSGSLGTPFGEDGGGGGGGGGGQVEAREVEVQEEKRSKVKDFFKGRLRRSSDSRSCSSLASDNSVSSAGSDGPAPPPSLDLMSDPPSSPVYTSKVRVDAHYGETDLAKKVLTSQHTTKVLTHKRAFSDEASRITTAPARPSTAVESLRGQTMTQSKSSLCINGSHVYDSEPCTPKSKLVLLEKCSPLSRSLQNLTKAGGGGGGEGRRWSFDKAKKEEKEEDKEAQASCPVQQAVSPDKGRKLRKTLFSGGRSDSLPAKSDPNPTPSASEGRLRGWFGSGDSQNKPRLEVSPKVESSSDAPPPLPPRSPNPPSPSDPCTNPFTPSPSPSSPTNPFPSQRNPFFEDLVAEEARRSPPLAPSSLGSSPFRYATLSPPLCSPAPTPTHHDVQASIKRERPRPVARQVSLPALLPKSTTPTPPANPSAPRSMSESSGEWEDSFDAFASSRLNSPKGGPPQKQPRPNPTPSQRQSYLPVNNNNHSLELQTCEEEPPPLPPRRLLRTPVNEIYSDGWLHRGQELAVHKEAYLLSQTGAASLQRGREGDGKRSGVSPDPQTGSETSDSLSAHSNASRNATSPGVACEETLKKFKYEPLGDDADCWGGMLFEQDLYGRVCRGQYLQPKVRSQLLSLNPGETAGDEFTSTNSRPKSLLDEISVAELLNMTSTAPPKQDAKTLETRAEEPDSPESSCLNNNVSFSLTLGDLNMNVNNSDFGFIDSDGSSQSEVAVDPLRCLKTGTFPPVPQDLQITAYRAETVAMSPPGDVFTLKDTYIPEMNSSFEVTSNKLCKVSPVCQENCGDCRNSREGNGRESTSPSSLNQTSKSPDHDEDRERSDSQKTRKEVDDNGNPQAVTQKEMFPGVVSARLRPRGVSRQSSSGGDSPDGRSRSSGDREFEQLLSLVKNITGVGEGPRSYQPTRSALSSLLALNKQTDPHGDGDETNHGAAAGKPSDISFQDLHAKVAPTSRTPLKSLQGSDPCPSTSCTSSADAMLPHPPAFRCPSMHPSGSGTALAVAPYTSTSTYSSSTSSTFSSSSSSTTAQPLVDAPPPLLPEESQPASSLLTRPDQSRPHPVKPLTSSQLEKKESRSVLEKLKSTIHPGRAAHQVPPEPEKSQEVTVDNTAQYQHLTNMELISLLLQQEMDMQKQQAASERQEAQLHKCEVELRKVKAQVRDLEDYIDNLLLRIMEQTPTLLQVRRHK